MPTEDRSARSRTGAASGALMLCRADLDSVGPVAHLLREPLLLTDAGDGWSVLVPEGTPWQHGGEPVDRVLTGWATALAVGASSPVLALWWDADRAGYTLASGFRRTVAYVWLADGTPLGEDEAMRTFATRLGLDPVLDVQSLDPLTKPDSGAAAPARLRALLAVLTRAGVSLPADLTLGAPTSHLREAARAQPGTREIAWPARRTDPQPDSKPKPEPTAPPAPSSPPPTHISSSPPNPWLPWSPTPRTRALALAQIAAGLPLALSGLRRRSGGWAAAGALLVAHGVLALAYDLSHPRD